MLLVSINMLTIQNLSKTSSKIYWGQLSTFYSPLLLQAMLNYRVVSFLKWKCQFQWSDSHAKVIRAIDSAH